MAMLKRNRKAAILLLLALMMVLGTAVVHAITIVIDGVREAVWDTGAGLQIPGIQNDPNEGPITDGYDIEQVLWTNDQNNMYFLMQTYADTIWTGTPRPTMVICLDTDNDTGTGGSYPNCNNMIGIDRSIIVQRLNASGTTLAVEVVDSDPNTGNYVGDGVGARQNNVNELSVALADLGLDSTTACINIIPAVIYFDNGIVDPDDNTPDTGTFTLSCGSPTAVTLQSITTSSSPVAALSVAAVLMLAVVSAGFVLYRRQGQAR